MSAGWNRILRGWPLADRMLPIVGVKLIKPTIVLYEVYKKNKWERGKETAAGRFRATQVIQLTESTAC